MKKMLNDQRDPYNTPSGIQYAGEPGISKDCLYAVVRFLQQGDHITSARLLTHTNDHCFLLSINYGNLVAIKSGFSSGYGGEGPNSLSYVLKVLDAHGVDIYELDVTKALISRLDSSSLTIADLEELESAKPIRPLHHWVEYVHEHDYNSLHEGGLFRKYPLVIPFAIIDSRLIDLAISFWDGPDDRLLTAYRRLEDIVRKRVDIDDHGSKLFSQVFLGPTAKLSWADVNRGEQTGRAQLFIGAFSAFRNPRAHREMEDNAKDQLTEFLLVNQLFRLEHEAIQNPEINEL